MFIRERAMEEGDNDRYLERKAERHVDAEEQIERQRGSGVARRTESGVRRVGGGVGEEEHTSRARKVKIP